MLIQNPSKGRHRQEKVYLTNLELLQRHHALSNQSVRVLFQHVLLPTDLLVHERLGEHGLVHLVVAEASVAHL